MLKVSDSYSTEKQDLVNVCLLLLLGSRDHPDHWEARSDQTYQITFHLHKYKPQLSFSNEDLEETLGDIQLKSFLIIFYIPIVILFRFIWTKYKCPEIVTTDWVVTPQASRNDQPTAFQYSNHISSNYLPAYLKEGRHFLLHRNGTLLSKLLFKQVFKKRLSPAGIY